MWPRIKSFGAISEVGTKPSNVRAADESLSLAAAPNILDIAASDAAIVRRRVTAGSACHSSSRVHWVRPEEVAEVTYLTWTEDNLLRQVSYQAQREDKRRGRSFGECPIRRARASTYRAAHVRRPPAGGGNPLRQLRKRRRKKGWFAESAKNSGLDAAQSLVSARGVG